MTPSSDTPRALVVGGGLVGICAALALQERGFAVNLLERDAPGAGASAGNAGVISPWGCVPQSLPGRWRKMPGWLLDPEGPVSLRWSYLLRLLPWLVAFLKAAHATRLPAIADAMHALNRESLDRYKALLHGTGEEALIADCLYLHLFRRPAGADLQALPWRLRLERGGELALAEGDALRELEPAISPDYRWGVVIKGQGRARDPARLGEVLADKFARRGGTIRQAEVSRLEALEGGRTGVVVEGEVLRAERVVIAAGAWSGRLLATLGLKPPLEAERGYHLVFTDPGVTLRHSLNDAERMFVVSSMAMGLRCAGNAEFAGLEAPPDYARAAVFARLAKRLLPGLNPEPNSAWMGIRPSLPDSLPCIGPVPGLADLLVAFGHAHLGLTGAPKTGAVIATLAAGETPDIDIAPYRIDRFP